MKPKCHKTLINQRYQTMLHRGEVDVVTRITAMARTAAIECGTPEAWQSFMPAGLVA